MLSNLPYEGPIYTDRNIVNLYETSCNTKRIPGKVLIPQHSTDISSASELEDFKAIGAIYFYPCISVRKTP